MTKFAYCFTLAGDPEVEAGYDGQNWWFAKTKLEMITIKTVGKEGYAKVSAKILASTTGIQEEEIVDTAFHLGSTDAGWVTGNTLMVRGDQAETVMRMAGLPAVIAQNKASELFTQAEAELALAKQMPEPPKPPSKLSERQQMKLDIEWLKGAYREIDERLAKLEKDLGV